MNSKTAIAQTLNSSTENFITLITSLNKHTEQELDRFKLPHPILGKVSLRELALFTSFHTIHHFELLKLKINKN